MIIKGKVPIKMKDLENVGAVCDACARAAGFVRKDKPVGVWMGECEICHERKPCTDLWHDWIRVSNNVIGTMTA